MHLSLRTSVRGDLENPQCWYPWIFFFLKPLEILLVQNLPVSAWRRHLVDGFLEIEQERAEAEVSYYSKSKLSLYPSVLLTEALSLCWIW